MLFIVYLNDLPCGLHQGVTSVIHADDTYVLLTARIGEEFKIKISGALDYMIDGSQQMD
jgi:hypothetical protein